MMKKIRKNYKRLVAFLLAAVMVITNVGGNAGTVFAAEEREMSLFMADGQRILEAVKNLKDQEEFGKEEWEELELDSWRKGIVKKYEKLLQPEEGKVYELTDLEIDHDLAVEGTDLRVFYNAKTKEVIFLFLNESGEAVDCCVNIDGYETKLVTVEANSTEAADMAEEKDAVKEKEEEAEKEDGESGSSKTSGGSSGSSSGGSSKGNSGNSSEVNKENKEDVTEIDKEENKEDSREEAGKADEDKSAEEKEDKAEDQSSDEAEGKEDKAEDKPLNKEENSSQKEDTASEEKDNGKEDAASSEEKTDSKREDTSEKKETSDSSKDKSDASDKGSSDKNSSDAQDSKAENTKSDSSSSKDSSSSEKSSNDSSSDRSSSDKSSSDKSSNDSHSDSSGQEKSLSVSYHKAAIAAVALVDLEGEGEAEAEEETTEEETEEEVSEEETEEETEKETEAAAVETEDAANAAETTAAEETTEEGTEAEEETTEKAEETEAEEETSKETEAEETKQENKEETDASSKNEEETTAEESKEGSSAGAAGSKEEVEGKNEDSLDDWEIPGTIYDSVTIQETIMAKAYCVELEDVKKAVALNQGIEETADFAVEYSVYPGNTAKIKGNEYVTAGENLYFAIEPKDGYEIAAVHANGAVLEAVEDITEIEDSSAWKGYAYVYRVEEVLEDLDVAVEMEEMNTIIAAAVYTAETADAIFTVDVPDGAFEEEVELRVTKIKSKAKLQELVEQANNALKEGQAIAEAEAYDIAFISLESGEEIEPLKPVAVDMSFKKAIVADKNEEATKEVLVVHLPDDAEAKTVASTENIDTTEFSFQADSFSLYMRALVLANNVSVGGTDYPMIKMAVNAAKDGETITLLNDITENVEFNVSKSVTIDLNDHTWTGRTEVATLSISKGNVEVKNGTMNAVGNSNAIEAKEGTLTLDNVEFIGAIKALSLSASTPDILTVKLNNCTFSENVRAVYATKATLTLENCKISDSKTSGTIVSLNNSKTTVINGEVSNNVITVGPVIQVSNGGSFVMESTTLTNNNSYGVVNTSSSGANITMKDVVATGNIGTGSMGSGGSVLNANYIKDRKIVLENVKAIGNENTKGQGGAFFFGGSSSGSNSSNSNSNTSIEIIGCEITGNTAKTSGGAIYLSNIGKTTITNTVINGNTAKGTGKIGGGGIYIEKLSGSVILGEGTCIYGNQAPNVTVKNQNQTTTASDDIALESGASSSQYASEDDVQRADLTLNCNTSVRIDGTDYILTKSDAAGLKYSSSSKYYWHAGYYTVTFEPVRVYLSASGSHTGGEGEVISEKTLAAAVEMAKDKGINKIYVCNSATVDIASAASLNSGITFVRCKDHPNNYMFTVNGNVTLNNAHIDGQNIASNKPMIYVPNKGNLTIAGDTVIENGRNTGNGGAIYVSQGSLRMDGGTITKNTAKQGGGIYALGGKLVAFEGGTVSNNTATGGNGGGGAYIEATSSEFGVEGGRTLFDSNVSAQLGGGVFLVNGTNANTHHYIYKATFTNNKSNRTGYYFDGGAIYVQSGTTAHMKNVYVSGNSDSDKANNGYTAVAVCPTGNVAE